MANDTLTVTDNRTKKTYEIPLFKGSIRTMDLRQIKEDAEDFGETFAHARARVPHSAICSRPNPRWRRGRPSGRRREIGE